MGRTNYQQTNSNTMMRPQTVAVILLLTALFIYILVLFMTTIRLADYRAISKDMRTLETEIAEYEVDFLDKSYELSVAYALERGYIEAQTVTFISDARGGTNVALLSNE